MLTLPTDSLYQETLTLTSTIPTSTSDTDTSAISSGNLSVGATVGVGIGVAVAVFLLLGVAGLAYRRYRRRRQGVAAGEDDHPPFSKSELGQVRAGLSSTPLSEMNGAPGLFELETKTVGKIPTSIAT